MNAEKILAEIGQFANTFKQQATPYVFVSASNFNLMDMHRWVKTWLDVNVLDCFDGSAKHVFIPTEQPHEVFNSVEAINLYLLKHPETQAKLAKLHSANNPLQVLFLFFDKELEALCQAQQFEINLPDNALVKDLDSKITTTELGNQVQVPSVPNVLAKVDSYRTLQTLAEQHHLGQAWVVQSAYGDSGKTTYFIKSRADYDKVAEKIESEPQVKVMKWIRCVGTAIEACATQQGTYVGPLLGEMIGFPELTPYAGGWCGNELYQENFTAAIRQQAQQNTQRLGEALFARGYVGYFEVDYLIDLDDGSLYLGEMNPRITGISALTNMSPFCQKTVPLFLLHLQAYQNQPIPFSAEDYNALCLAEGAQGTSSQMIIKWTQSELNILDTALESGVYQLDETGQLHCVRLSAEPTDTQQNPNLGYVMRIMKPEDYVYKGADLAIVFLNIQLTEQQGKELNALAKQWISAIRAGFKTRALSSEQQQAVSRFNRPTSLKGATE